MSNFQGFVIEFDRPGATYAPGETVTGKINFSVPNPENVREIRWKASGVAKTSWTESSSSSDMDGNSSSDTKWYGTKEKYFKISNRLVGSNAADEQTTIAVGQYSYPFSFQLPVNIPCSFEHRYGHVRYTVQAIIDRPWRLNHKVDSRFTVVASNGVNVLPVQPGQSRPIHDEFEHKFLYCCCFSAGVMNITVTSGESKLHPEETVELIINHDSSSTRVDVTKMTLKLVKKMTFYDSTNNRSTKQRASEVLNKTKRDIGPFGKVGENLLKITLPRLLPSNMEYCSIIEVNYELDLIIHVSGMHCKITRSYPVQL